MNSQNSQLKKHHCKMAYHTYITYCSTENSAFKFYQLSGDLS